VDGHTHPKQVTMHIVDYANAGWCRLSNLHVAKGCPTSFHVWDEIYQSSQDLFNDAELPSVVLQIIAMAHTKS
jgi:hypothetical protein